ncbi:MAG: phosphoenolpyruvate mutase [Clostridiales bacterium]|nr:phosphoenolpyruvate mutase [Clostridiales bacterium]
MKALILNSGTGSRMGDITRTHPKCMTEIGGGETILSRQLRLLSEAGVRDMVITTGSWDEAIRTAVKDQGLDIRCSFVCNPIADRTNYIYSMYLAREALADDDLLLLHGDLVFEWRALEKLLQEPGSGMAVSMDLPLPEKDFKAVIHDGKIEKVGIEFFEDAAAAQPMYVLRKADMTVWMQAISSFVEQGEVRCYAENALNTVTDKVCIHPVDMGKWLCNEIDTPQDLEKTALQLEQVEKKTVYMCFSTDVLHAAHLRLIGRAAKLGHVTVGILSDEAVASYKRFPLLTCEERMEMFRNVTGVEKVVEQKTLSYRENLTALHPDFVVHGDNWKNDFQKPIREEVLSLLEQWGGELVEYPYTSDPRFGALEGRARSELALPDSRRARLRRLIAMKGLVTAMEAHSGITGLIVEKTVVHEDNGGAHQFDAMWISSLCDSTAKGKPDIELVDMSSRFRTIDDILEVTTKPIIFDGDTGGLPEHFVYTVRTLERMGVSMVIIEDKTGLKKNSLFGTEVRQTQDDIEHFAEKIRAGKRAQKTRDFMICARIESLILEKGMQDALERATAFVQAGADAIMIHSRKKDPQEIFDFVEAFRKSDSVTPLVVVPSSFNTVTEDEWKKRGVNVVIYANQLTRAGFPAMQKAAETILHAHRAKECDDFLMPIKEIIRLVPEDND